MNTEVAFPLKSFDLQPAAVYCNVCGCEIVATNIDIFLQGGNKTLCGGCMQEGGKAKDNQSFCSNCGEVIRKVPFKTKSGVILTSAHLVYCSDYCKFSMLTPAEKARQVLEENLTIHAECKCQKPKINHHFDYNRPLDVIKLCRACHSFEHGIINKCIKKGVID